MALAQNQQTRESDRLSKDVTETQQRLVLPTVTLTWHAKDVTQTQQQRHVLPTVSLTWHVIEYIIITYKVHKLYHRYIIKTKQTKNASQRDIILPSI